MSGGEGGTPGGANEEAAGRAAATEWTVVAVVKDALAKASSPREAIRTFLGETIWRWDLAAMAPPQARITVALRMLYLVGRAFVASRAQQQAMALTYTTMLALVPAFAIMVAVFSVSGRGDEARGRLETFVVDALAASPEQAAVLSRWLNDLVANLQGSGGVAGLSFFVFLFFTIIALLSTLEKTLNDIWQIKRSRSFINKFVTYWCIATMGPILLGTALVQGSSLQSSVAGWTTWGRDVGASLVWGSEEPGEADQASAAGPRFAFDGVGGVFAADLEARARAQGEPSLEQILFGTRSADDSAGFDWVALGLTLFTFTLLYALFPNTRVRLRPALIGAVTAALLWTGTKWALALSSATLVRYNAVYGSLATIPITMFWLYLTWLIVILGAEVSFAAQNLKSQRKEELATDTSAACTEMVALRLCAAIGLAFERGERPPRLDLLGARIGAPLSLCASLLFHLTQDGLLRELERDDDERGYVPARPLDRITMGDVLDSLRERRGISFELSAGADLDVVRRHLDRAESAARALSARVTLRQLVDELAAAGAALAADDPETMAVAIVAKEAARASGTARLGSLRSPEPADAASEPRE